MPSWKIVDKSQIKLAGYIVRMKDVILPKRSAKKTERVAENEEDHGYDGRIV